MDPTQPTLEIDSILLDFGQRRLLSDIYIKCSHGQITSLIGRNGSGKSCLMKIIMGHLNPLSKSIRLNQKTIRNPFPHINYLPQSHFVPGHLSVKDVLCDYQIRASEFSKDFPDLMDITPQKLRKLSGGMKRLVEVYTLVKSEASFTILDEPFTQIMPIHLKKIKVLIKNQKQKGFLITDHLYRDVLDIADSSFLLQNGKTWPVSTLADLKARGYINNL